MAGSAAGAPRVCVCVCVRHGRASGAHDARAHERSRWIIGAQQHATLWCVCVCVRTPEIRGIKHARAIWLYEVWRRLRCVFHSYLSTVCVCVWARFCQCCVCMCVCAAQNKLRAQRVDHENCVHLWNYVRSSLWRLLAVACECLRVAHPMRTVCGPELHWSCECVARNWLIYLAVTVKYMY